MGVAVDQLLQKPQPQQIGRVDSLDLSRATAIRASLPKEWLPLLNNPSGAQAMMFALILSEDAGLLETEMAVLREHVDADILAVTLRQHQKVQELSSAVLMAVIDLAIPSLRRLSPESYRRFASILEKLMASDQQIDLFEFMVQKMLRRHLDLWFMQTPPPKVKFQNMANLKTEAHVILSVLARASGPDEASIQAAYAEAMNQLEPGNAGPLLPTDWQALDRALDQFDLATPMVKKQLLYAAGKAAMADSTVRNEEAELLRAVADTIGCPIPPFVALA
jgi:hypothetical protein